MKFSAIFALASLLVLTPAVLLNSAGTTESEAKFPFGIFTTPKKPKLAQADASSAGTTESEANFPFVFIKPKLAQLDSSNLAEKPYHS